MAVDKHLQWQQLLQRLPEDTPLEALREILCPTVASTKEQQQRFYDLFEQSLEAVEALNSSIEDNFTLLPEEKRKQYWWWIPFLLLLGIVGYFYWPQPTTEQVNQAPVEDEIPTQYFTVAPGETKQYCLSEEVLQITGENITKAFRKQTNAVFGKGEDEFCFTYTAPTSAERDTLWLGVANPKRGWKFLIIALIENPIEAVQSKPQLFPPKVRPKSAPLEDLVAKPLTDYEQAFLDYEPWIRRYCHWLADFVILATLTMAGAQTKKVDCRSR